MQILQEWCRLSRNEKRVAELFSGLMFGDARILFIEVGLESVFGIIRQAGEFDAHTNSGISRAYGRSGRKTFLVNPDIDAQNRRNRQGHRGLNITTVSADVSGIYPHRRVDPLIAEFQRKRNFMTLKSPAIVRSRSGQV